MPAAKKEDQAGGGPAVNIPVAGRVPIPRVPVPSRKDAIYYGGLGAMTALELIEWPITLAVAAGYALATHDRHHEDGQ
jgi:hypothetical protein